MTIASADAVSLSHLFPTILDAPVEDRLATAICAVAAEVPDRAAIVSSAGVNIGSTSTLYQRSTTDYANLARRITQLEARLAETRPIGIVARAKRVESLIAIAAACGRQHVPLAILAEDARDLIGELHDWLILDDSLIVPDLPPGTLPRSEFETVPPRIVVATSGTSGPPKLVDHSWDSLLAAARLAEQWQGRGWLLVYDATRWAGIQVWLQALLTGGRIVVPASRDPDTVVRAVVDDEVAILPGTPTLLRRVLTSADRDLLSGNVVERITLGGEAADGPLLEMVQEVFPRAKVTQVYATTELGEVFRVTDGKAGFPAAWIGKSLPGGAHVRVRRDGELLVQLHRDTAEVATGDLVEQTGDRYEFVGRRSDVIVVGGAKVYPKRVEEVLRDVPGVVEARVYAVPSPITGELVAAEIVPAAEADGGRIRDAAIARCREKLEPHAVPRVVDCVEKTATTAAGKTPRRGR